MFTRQFWTLTTERMIKTFAQTLASVLAASGAGLLSAGWTAALSAAGMAAVVSVLTSVGSLKIGPADSPSVVPTQPASRDRHRAGGTGRSAAARAGGSPHDPRPRGDAAGPAQAEAA